MWTEDPTNSSHANPLPGVARASGAAAMETAKAASVRTTEDHSQVWPERVDPECRRRSSLVRAGASTATAASGCSGRWREGSQQDHYCGKHDQRDDGRNVVHLVAGQRHIAI
jgi:hypothetical protein